MIDRSMFLILFSFCSGWCMASGCVIWYAEGRIRSVVMLVLLSLFLLALVIIEALTGYILYRG